MVGKGAQGFQEFGGGACDNIVHGDCRGDCEVFVIPQQAAVPAAAEAKAAPLRNFLRFTFMMYLSLNIAAGDNAILCGCATGAATGTMCCMSSPARIWFAGADWGRIPVIRAAWLRWDRDQGHLPSDQ